MASIGALSVELEITGDGDFITRLSRAGAAVDTFVVSAKALGPASDSLDAALARMGQQATTAASSISGLLAPLKTIQAQMSALGADSVSAAQKMASATAQMAQAMQQQAQATAQATTSLTTHLAAIQRIQAAAAKGASFKLSSTGSGFSFNVASLAGLVTGFAGLTGAAVLAQDAFKLVQQQIAGLVDAGDRYTASLNRIQSATGTTRTAAIDTYTQLQQAAEKTGIGTDDLVQSYQRFAIALKGVGATRQQTIDFTTTLSELARVSGTSGAAAARAFVQLGQGVSVGTLQLHDLKPAMEDMPALADALAKALGTTTGGLLQMATAGKLTTEVILGAVQKMGPEIAQQFNSLPATLANARTSLADAADKLRATLDQKLGLSQLLASWDKGLADLLQRMDNSLATSGNQALKNAQDKLAELKALAAGGGATITGINADPTASTSLSQAALQQQIAAQQQLIAQLKEQAGAQDALDQVNASAAAKQHALTEAADDMTKALEKAGLAGGGASPLIDQLSAAIQSGNAIAVPYNDTLLKATDLLSLLQQKATPAAAALADLNKQLVEAQAKAQGGFQAALTAARLKADPADPTGQGANLSAATNAALVNTETMIRVATGQLAVQKAQDKLLLAQAQHVSNITQDGGRAASRELIRQSRAEYIRENGNSPEVVKQADQIASAETQAANLQANDKAIKQAQQGTSVVTELKARIAELHASMTDGGTEVAKWTEKLKTASPVVKAQADQIIALAGQVDQLTAANKRAEESAKALASLREKAASAKGDAAQALAEEGDGKRSTVQRQVDQVKRQLTAAMSQVTPDQQGQAQSLIDSTVNDTGLAAVRRLVEANQTAALEVNKAWDDSLAGRQKAAITAVDQESASLTSLIATYVTDADEKKRLTAETTAYIATRYKQAARQTEGPIAQMARQWADYNAAVETALSSTMSNFVDTLVDKLNAGTATWKDWADTAIKSIEKVALQATISGLFTAASSSSSGILSSLGSVFGLSSSTGSQASAVASSGEGVPTVSVVGHHKGGMAGTEPTFNRTVPASIFNAARRYHTGGLAGDEVPAILQRGEGVFTKGQMAAIGAMNANDTAIQNTLAAVVQATTAPASAAPSLQGMVAANDVGNGSGGLSAASQGNVTVNLHNQTGTPQTATAGKPKFDGEQWVIDIVTKSAQQPGKLRSALKGG